MLLKKKKILNIKYKSSPQSNRLLDKQFTIYENNRFRISIKESSYYFYRRDEKSSFCISTTDQTVATIDFGKTVKIKHQDGTDIFFTLHEDFLYSTDYDNTVYIVFALVINAIFFTALQLLVPNISRQLNDIKKVSLDSFGDRHLANQTSEREVTTKKEVDEELLKVRICYEEVIWNDPKHAKGLKLEWKVNEMGKAYNIKVLQPVLSNARLHQCISNVLLPIKFPSPQDGKDATVKYYLK